MAGSRLTNNRVKHEGEDNGGGVNCMGLSWNPGKRVIDLHRLAACRCPSYVGRLIDLGRMGKTWMRKAHLVAIQQMVPDYLDEFLCGP